MVGNTRNTNAAGRQIPQRYQWQLKLFQSFCVDYYTPAQCTGAIRFVLKTSGSQYFERLHYEESVDGFLDQLAVMVKGGEALKAGEALATKEGD